MDVHVVPLLVVFQTPPVAKPTYIVLGSLSTTAMSSTRPPTFAGPMDRHTKGRRMGSSDWLMGAGSGGAGGGPCANRPCAAAAHSATPAHVHGRARTNPRFKKRTPRKPSRLVAERHLRHLPGFRRYFP